jgi:DNA modification methylase
VNAIPLQMDLFDYVAKAYGSTAEGVLENERLYHTVAAQAGIPEEVLEAKVAIGKSGQEHSPLKRAIRWQQQNLKRLGLIERVEDVRGLWQLTKEGRHRLRRAADKVSLLAFSTSLGVAIWGDCRQIFSRLDEPIHLVITSPPYPLAKPRAYGNPKESEYVDFICGALEPVVANLVAGGSLCLNISNDIFEQGSPARSLYQERLVLALHDRLGLFLIDRLIWHNGSKAPGPVQWASLKRVQLNVAYEPVLWFSNDPHKVRSDNRRVLEPHTERQQRLIAAGGCQEEATYADGAYRRRKGSYGNETPGRIPRNVLSFGHSCPDNKEYRQDCERLGLPPHGAVFPATLPNFLIRFLTEPGDLVADPFGGKITTGRQAEELGRRWISTEWIYEYIRGAADRFRNYEGFWLNPALCSS